MHTFYVLSNGFGILKIIFLFECPKIVQGYNIWILFNTDKVSIIKCISKT